MSKLTEISARVLFSQAVYLHCQMKIEWPGESREDELQLESTITVHSVQSKGMRKKMNFSLSSLHQTYEVNCSVA